MAQARSKAYPGIPLGEAIEKLQILSKKLGSSPSYNKETFAVGMGYNGSNNGAFLRSVAALSHFGLIRKKGGDYILTAIARKILFPTTSEDRIEAIRESALSPSLFQQLYSMYAGQELPDLLPNILVTNFNILPSVKDKAASLFRASMEYAGLLDGNKLRADIDPGVEDPGPAESDDQNIASARASINQPPIQLVAVTTLTKDFGEGRVASLSIPTDISEDEREKLKTLIGNM